MSRSTIAIPATATDSISVRNSKIHGKGVFAKRKITAGTCIIEYAGKRITEKQAVKRKEADADNPFHTFFFSLDTGKMIDGDDQGNDARWINHCCAPNCEAREEKGKVFIYAVTDIRRGDELNYDYGLIIGERHTAKAKRNYECRCGASTCRGTMLALKRR